MPDASLTPRLDGRALARSDQLAKPGEHVLDDLSRLDRFAAVPFPPGHPKDRRTFYSPVDDVHGALVYVLSSARRSVVLAMYGFDDEELAQVIKEKLENPIIYVQLTLDSSQAGGVHEKTLLAKEDYPLSSVVSGRSEKGAIMHLKEVVIDGVIVVTGSTNWSEGGESKQDNQLTVELNPFIAAQASARIGGIHASMLQKAKGGSHARPRKATAASEDDDEEGAGT